MTGSDREIPGSVSQELAPRPIRGFRARIFELGLLLAALGFSVLAFLAYTNPFLPIDLVITQFLQSFQFPWLLSLMKLISWFGYAIQSIILILLAYLLLRALHLHWEAVVTALGSGFVLLLNTIVKLLVQRSRPSFDLVTVFREMQSYSFPSGHVMFYVGFFGFLLFLSFTLFKNSWKRTLLIILFSAMIVLVGPSRIYLGEHWASDVTGAYLLGSLALWVVIRFYRRAKSRYYPRLDG